MSNKGIVTVLYDTMINSFLQEILFPPLCFGCNRLGTHICHTCLEKLEPAHDESCVLCGKRQLDVRVACDCARIPLGGTLSLWKLNPTIRKFLHALKYEGHRDAGVALMTHLNPSHMVKMRYFISGTRKPILVPVPLHRERQRERGFNQSELIAQALGCLLGLPVLPEGVVQRSKRAKSQVKTKSREERQKNILGSFTITNVRDFSDVTPIVVDDVITTGATVNELARTLSIVTSEQPQAICLAHER